MSISFTKTFIALAFSGLTISSVHAKNTSTDIKEVRNEAGIMLNILQATLKQQNNDKNIRFKADSVFYLANQGVVFEIESGRRGGNFFGFDLNGLMNNLPVAPPVPPVPGSSKGNSTNFEININQDEIERMVMSFIDHGEDFGDDIRDELKHKMRELSDEQRQLGWEKREYDRTRRDLEFEQRNADKERRKEIEKRFEELDKEVQKLESKSKELEKYRHGIEAQRNEEIAKRKAAKQQLYKVSLSLFEDTIGDMLCRYGAGLRSLADNENVTFLLSDFVDADNDSVINSHDKVYVFKHQDIQACVTGKTNKDKLLSAATTYLF